LEPFQLGLCNCGCGLKLEENGGLLNKDGTRRKFIKYHHLKSKIGFKHVSTKGTPHKAKTHRKEIAELRKSVKELRAKIDTMQTRSKLVHEPPFEARPRPTPPPPLPPSAATTATTTTRPLPLSSPKNPLMLALVEMLKNSRIPMRIDDMARKACESNPELKYHITDGLRNENGIYTLGGNKKLRVLHSALAENPNIMVVGVRPAMLMWVAATNPSTAPAQQRELDEIMLKNRQISELVEMNRKLMLEREGLQNQLEFNRDAAETQAGQKQQTTLSDWDDYSISNKNKREKSHLF
jgi:hypothetical protein